MQDEQKIQIRIPGDLKRKAEKLAKKKDLSLSQLIRKLIKAAR